MKNFESYKPLQCIKNLFLYLWSEKVTVCVILLWAIILVLLWPFGKDLWNLYKCGFANGCDLIKHIDGISNAIMALATIILVLVAYSKFSDLKRVQRTENLVKIDERWSSPEIIEARTILHEMYTRFGKEIEDKKEINKNKIGREYIASCKIDYETICNKIGNEIVMISQVPIPEKDPSRYSNGITIEQARKYQNEFMKLLNFLEFLEFLGYLVNKGDINEEELKELVDHSIDFEYKVFRPYIEYKREKHKKESFYINFEKLARHSKFETTCDPCKKNR